MSETHSDTDGDEESGYGESGGESGYEDNGRLANQNDDDGSESGGESGGERGGERGGEIVGEKKLAGRSAASVMDLTRKFELSDDPMVAVAINDAHRRLDVAEGADLWSADQVRAALPRQYVYPVPTFVPGRWPVPRPVTQAEYSAKFAEEFPEVSKMGPIDNVVIAGGAAAWPFGEPSSKASDVDLFIYGLDPNDEPALWRKVKEISVSVNKVFMCGEHAAAAIRQTLSPGLVTFTIGDRVASDHPRLRVSARKIQIILRVYPTVSSIIHAFDIPSACVAYDWKYAYTTTLGAYAQAFRVNVVVPAYRSTTYEKRLIKYASRGYALALPQLRPEVLVKGQATILPHLHLNTKVVRGNFAAGTIEEAPSADSAMDSDYEPYSARTCPVTRFEHLAKFGPMQINVRQLASGDNRFVVMKSWRSPSRERQRGWYLVGSRPDPIPFGKYAVAGGPKFADILPHSSLERFLDRCIGAVVNTHGRVSVKILRTIFRCADAEINTLVAAAASALETCPPGHRLDMSQPLERFRANIMRAYDAVPSAVEWWIKTDPGRQHTASRNPRMEDPAVWYGDAFQAEPRPPTSDNFVQALIATLESRQVESAGGSSPIYADGMCALCQSPLQPGAANSITLPCGHVFHWSSGAECDGLFEWTSRGNVDCPTCRGRFAEAESESPRPRPRVPVMVTW